MRDARELARDWIEIWDRGDPSALPLADDFVHVSPFGRLEGRARYLAVVEPMAKENVAALEIDDVFAEGDRACITFSMETANGPVACCDVVRVADGRIRSVHSYYDSRRLPHFEEY